MSLSQFYDAVGHGWSERGIRAQTPHHAGEIAATVEVVAELGEVPGQLLGANRMVRSLHGVLDVSHHTVDRDECLASVPPLAAAARQRLVSTTCLLDRGKAPQAIAAHVSAGGQMLAAPAADLAAADRPVFAAVDQIGTCRGTSAPLIWDCDEHDQIHDARRAGRARGLRIGDHPARRERPGRGAGTGRRAGRVAAGRRQRRREGRASHERDQPDRDRDRRHDAVAAEGRPRSLEVGRELHRLRGRRAGQYAAGQGRVVEGFLYGCGHCYTLEPRIESWEKSKPDWVVLKRVPVNWNEVTREDARLFYAIESLGRLDELHTAMFREIHSKRRPLTVIRNGRVDKAETRKAAREFLAANGVSGQDFEKHCRIFSAENKLRQPGREALAPVSDGPHADVGRAWQVPDGRRNGRPRRPALRAGKRPGRTRAPSQLT